MRALLYLSFLFLSSNVSAQKKSNKIIEFWKNSDYRVVNKFMSDASRALYFRIIQPHYPHESISDIIAKIETLSEDDKLQDYLFLKFMELYGKGEAMRFVFADICGSNALGNYVSDYVVQKYSNDPRYLKFLKEWEQQKIKNANEAKKQRDEKPLEEIKEDRGIQTNDIVDTLNQIKKTKIEIEAVFPGGEISWRNYLKDQLMKFADLPKQEVVITYIITTTGSTDSVEIEKPTNTPLDQALIQIIKSSPKWEPAKQNGFPVQAYRRQPITLGTSDE